MMHMRVALLGLGCANVAVAHVDCDIKSCFSRCEAKFGPGWSTSGSDAYYCSKGCARLVNGEVTDPNLFCAMEADQRYGNCINFCATAAVSREETRQAQCRYGCGFWQQVPPSPTPPVPPTSPSFCDEPGWEISFHDEFDEPELDTSSWSVTIGQSTGRTRDAIGTADNVYIENGALVLRSKRSSGADDLQRDSSDRRRRSGNSRRRSESLTTGAVDTKGKRHWGNVRVCVSAMLPGSGAGKSDGIWPAIWMDPKQGIKKNGEIDIMEMINGDCKSRTTYHWGDNDTSWSDHQDQGSSQVANCTSAFHEYAVEYTKKSVRFALDGKVVHTVKGSARTHDEDYYLILNTALGGSWPKPISSDTVFPVYHRFDYVRVARRSDVIV